MITLLVSSTFFTSTVTLCFVWLKSTFPKLKGSLFFGAIIWYFTISFFIGILSSLDVDSIWVLNFLELVIIMLSIATCYLVAWMDKKDYFTKIESNGQFHLKQLGFMHYLI